MGVKRIETPRLQRKLRTGKITVYPEKEIQRLYELAQDNGWDAPSIVRAAVVEALVSRKNVFVTKAPEED